MTPREPIRTPLLRHPAHLDQLALLAEPPFVPLQRAHRPWLPRLRCCSLRGASSRRGRRRDKSVLARLRWRWLVLTAAADSGVAGGRAPLAAAAYAARTRHGVDEGAHGLGCGRVTPWRLAMYPRARIAAPCSLASARARSQRGLALSCRQRAHACIRPDPVRLCVQRTGVQIAWSAQTRARVLIVRAQAFRSIHAIARLACSHGVAHQRVRAQGRSSSPRRGHRGTAPSRAAQSRRRAQRARPGRGRGLARAASPPSRARSAPAGADRRRGTSPATARPPTSRTPAISARPPRPARRPSALASERARARARLPDAAPRACSTRWSTTTSVSRSRRRPLSSG